ncbi:MAG: sulfurtransferase TusA family protein [Thermoleophilia bacterium]|jgi:tRNA 2-thiouridine synthesizing protein A|nr:sulfurtransferase TusA family protein [Actinomycetota bacterium]MCL6092306.1 sulfurtransferase TusA family protein [Actinomycetota bacterium]MDA8166460.1 sulfurtransferase TusA family protein [Actinomycetota bacterium]
MGEVIDVKPDSVLDVKGLCCPMPVVKAKKAMETIEVGQVLEIVGTDAGSKGDMPAWAKRAGHEFLGSTEEEGGEVFHFFVRKGK